MTQPNFSYPEDAKPWLDSLPSKLISHLPLSSALTLTFIDGRHLSCPMPLLKTKVALRSVHANDLLYVIATDPNSQADITAFCGQSQLNLQQTTTDHTGETVYHFFIINNK